MVTANTNRKEAGVPIMLWIRNHMADHDQSLNMLRRHDCEVLVAESIEEGVETLMHQPVDVLIVDMPILNMTEPSLMNEISRCWPYLLCLVVSDDQTSDSVLQQHYSHSSILTVADDAACLLKQLLSSLGEVEGKERLH